MIPSHLEGNKQNTNLGYPSVLSKPHSVPQHTVICSFHSSEEIVLRIARLGDGLVRTSLTPCGTKAETQPCHSGST